MHINKGRLHAFRKLSPDPLPKNDAHAVLRQKVLDEVGTDDPSKFVCKSVAWDWMYLGSTAAGINREIVSTLECTILNRHHTVRSLAIPEFSLWHVAKSVLPRLELDGDGDADDQNLKEILRGIQPALKYLVDSEEQETYGHGICGIVDGVGDPVHQAKMPDSYLNPALAAIDPFGKEDFDCKICYKELGVSYMHCDGCEELLSSDYNICVDCHRSGKHRTYSEMNGRGISGTSLHQHMGHIDGSQPCTCGNLDLCPRCSACPFCNCRCHRSFTLHRRRFPPRVLHDMLGQVNMVVGDDTIKFSGEVFQRLQAVKQKKNPSKEDQKSS